MEAKEKLPGTSGSVSWLIRQLSQPQGSTPPETLPESERISAEKLHSELDSRHSASAEIALAILPNGDSSNSEFYRRLSQIHQFVGISDATDRLVGRIWISALSLTQNPEPLLNALLQADNFGFWSALRALPNVLIAVPIRPSFAANLDRKSTRLNSSHIQKSRMPSSA